MSESVGSRNMDKKLIQIDISSDTVCPWCFVGKKNLDKAISASQDQYHFEVLSYSDQYLVPSYLICCHVMYILSRFGRF